MCRTFDFGYDNVQGAQCLIDNTKRYEKPRGNGFDLEPENYVMSQN